MNIENGKAKIILVMPDNFDFIGMIEKNLIFCGYSVVTVSGNAVEKLFSYPDLKSKLANFFRKTFYKDKSIKENLKKTWRKTFITGLLAENTYDFAIFIRPDLVHRQLIELVRPYVRKHMIGYQWDGLSRNPKIKELIPKFDKFFVFDVAGFSNGSCSPVRGITNFYFDMDGTTVRGAGNGRQKSAYFIGSHQNQRARAVSNLVAALSALGVKTDFTIIVSGSADFRQYDEKGISFSEKTIGYEENLVRMQRADILVDLINPIHSGLSFRIFEALFYGKKIITDNRTVKEYDFYRPENIFVLEPDNLPALRPFLESPLKKLPEDIVKKYGFTNWIRNILDERPYREIRLPANRSESEGGTISH